MSIAIYVRSRVSLSLNMTNYCIIFFNHLHMEAAAASQISINLYERLPYVVYNTSAHKSIGGTRTLFLYSKHTHTTVYCDIHCANSNWNAPTSRTFNTTRSIFIYIYMYIYKTQTKHTHIELSSSSRLRRARNEHNFYTILYLIGGKYKNPTQYVVV